MKPIVVSPNGYKISADKRRLDMGVIHDFLSNRSYWANGIPFDVVKKSVENSLCLGVYHRDHQVGFARAVTDFATVAYLADIFILEPYRGKGLGTWLVQTLVGRPELSGLRLLFLGTKDAHELYERYGFRRVVDTPLVGRLMAIHRPDIYRTENPHEK